MTRTKRKNSKPHENKPLRVAYLEAHPFCLLCRREPSTEVHHIRRFPNRADVDANLAALCHKCHFDEVHSPKSKWAEMTIKILDKKRECGEYDPLALNAIGKPYMVGWLDQHKPATGVLLSMWFQLVKECET